MDRRIIAVSHWLCCPLSGILIAMKYLISSLCMLALFPGSLLAQFADPGSDAIQRRVVAVERSFAQTMADRDFDAFGKFIAEEAVFFSGAEPLRGKARVLEAWQAYFESPDAPFSWQPETVER